jgi:hypothetical protein
MWTTINQCQALPHLKQRAPCAEANKRHSTKRTPQRCVTTLCAGCAQQHTQAVAVHVEMRFQQSGSIRLQAVNTVTPKYFGAKPVAAMKATHLRQAGLHRRKATQGSKESLQT